MDVDKINRTLLVKTLNFHGVQLQKIFEAEYQNFSHLKIFGNLHFNEYAARQKQLSFQDRGKRFRLQQFICRNANQIFDRHVKPIRKDRRTRTLDTGYFPVLPPYESFLSIDKHPRWERFFEYVNQGDIIVASVLSKTAAGMILKVLFGESDEIRCVPDVGIKAFCPASSLIAAADKKTNISRAFLINDIVCCEIVELNVDTGKITCGMKGVHCSPENQLRLGLMHSDDFPVEYRVYQDKKDNALFNVLLEKSESFQNPNVVNNLMMHLGIPNELYTHMDYLKEKFPAKDCAVELRIAQAAKWAIQSVADGVEHFKCGRLSEAYQCLNKALSIDPRNVEALVARGALYANSSNYEKAIIDFENALKFNPNHQNAKKYLGDTLVAFGRAFEENGRFTEAINAYETCLTIIPNHEEASNSLQFIRKKLLASSKKENVEEFVETSKIQGTNSKLNQLLTQDDDVIPITREVKKSKSKRRDSSSSSSSSSSDSSSDSSDSSSSSSSSSRSKKKKSKKSKKEPSLSPLSKRMIQMENAGFKQAGSSYQAWGMSIENEYELRVRKFLEETKRDEDYEDKVRKFLDETAKWKKKQKIKEEKSKRKKKVKKLKTKKKKRETKKKKRRKHRSESVNEGELVLQENTLKDLEDLQSKLSAYYSKVEKSTTKSGKKEKHTNDKKNQSSKRKSSSEDIEEIVPEPSEKIRRPVEIKEPEPYVNEDYTAVEPQKPESNAYRFKMQLNTVTNKVKRRSSEDPLWGEDQTQPEPADEPSTSKPTSKSRFDPIMDPSVSSVKRSRSPPVLDKLGSFLIKKRTSASPKRDSYQRRRSFSRSLSRTRESPRRNTRYRPSPHRSSSRRRYSRSRSRSGSYSRSRNSRYSRSRSRSPYYKDRDYNYRSRNSGTYYKPRAQNYQGDYRDDNWKSNRSGEYSSRYRDGRDDRDYTRRRRNDSTDRAPSNEESKDTRRDPGNEGKNRETSYEKHGDNRSDLKNKSDRSDRRKSVDRTAE
ncbi:tetratricopeptide repeat protein 14 homolog isoform X2 [Planococcus citri]|uniref:tetratricopeptide repeat protein 14 homolog isoform X2 n=1 Tax=Planococcus citri TaxID=170843 RepID=UPI0031F958C5